MRSSPQNLVREPVHQLPLCVDLDGTLAAVDTFYASVFALLRKNFFYLLLFPFWVLRGKAYAKQQVARRSPLDLGDLPFHRKVLEFLLEQHSSGRELILTTGADRLVAERISQSLGIFSDVICSDGSFNLTGPRKASVLSKRFGSKGFDYIANSEVDLEVWSAAANAYVVSNSTSLLEKARSVAVVAGVFSIEEKSSSLGDYVSIARPDHWFKNVFVLPGMLLAYFFFPMPLTGALVWDVLISLAAVCLVASSNYVINEILDAERDRHHPVKKMRPLAAGRVSIPLAYLEWIVLGAVGCAFGFLVNQGVGWSCLSLWIMGTLYNIPPIRTKEVPYLDVLSEAVNNPIRMAIGWYAMGVSIIPPVSALFAYWMFGSFLMATKRFAEYRRIGDPARAAEYRWSFHYYNEERLIMSSVFYIAMFMTGAMAFVTIYRLELVFSMPFVAYLLAYYLYLGFKPDSPVQYPELLYRERHLTKAVIACSIVCCFLFFYDIPEFRKMFVLLTPP